MENDDLISRRALAVDASGIRKAFDLAAKMKDPINLSIGLPDFDVPEPAKEAAIAAIRAGNNRYSQTQGIAPLRERLRSDLSTEIGRDVGQVLVTSGVAGGLFLGILATIDPGEEVIFLDPYFVMYKHMVTMAGGRSLMIDSYPDFHFRAEKVAAAITPKTKVMILGSPANPTGAVLSESDIRAAVEIAKVNNLLIISDEIYA
ncbi:MAG: aminotransferase class I/II-fold pyridoxal phosphate-dependent enzyme, partial [Phycisphaerae bacterium]|nr:aminotransferase class I/II-fold pyridoxal phosphate-dependent enzyme [Phycisphaerae bacterium]